MRVFVALALIAFSSAAGAFTFDPDVPDAIKQQMLQDLDFMKSIQGSGASPLHQQIYGQVNGAAYDHFFQSRIEAIGMNRCGSMNAVACVLPLVNHTKMWLTQNFITFKHPQIARMLVVYHEARHTETDHNFWTHAKCPTPFLDTDGSPLTSIWTQEILAGQPTCDNTPFGSYGSSTILLKNLAKSCTNCSDKVKQDADIYADDQLKRIIDPRAKQAMIIDFHDQ